MKNVFARLDPSTRRKVGVMVGVVLLGGAVTVEALEFPAGRVAASRSRPMTFVPSTSPPAAPLAPRAALRAVAASMAGSQIASARIGTPPSGAPSSSSKSAVPALYVTAKIPSLSNGEDVEPLWEADVLEGAVVELAGSSKSLENDVGWVRFSGRLPDGTFVPNVGGGMGDVARGQQFAGARDGYATIERRARGGLRRYAVSSSSA
jgi:hypothetical protein